MSHARHLLDRLFSGPTAPVEAPPKPDVKPDAPPRPSTPAPGRPSPWRRKEIKPGEHPRPKAAYGLDTTYSEAQEFLRINGLAEFLKESA